MDIREVICPLAFPEHVYCDENCNECSIYLEFKNFMLNNYIENNKKEKSNE